jgi:hypothetical protein
MSRLISARINQLADQLIGAALDRDPERVAEFRDAIKKLREVQPETDDLGQQGEAGESS